MSTITINGAEKDIRSVDAAWITNQIDRRRSDGQLVCVQVELKESTLKMLLATPTCATTAGGGRAPNTEEAEVVDFWNKCQLSTHSFPSDGVAKFVNWLQGRLH